MSHARIARITDRLVVAAPAELGPPELTTGLPAALAAVPDPRARRGIRHRLIVVLTAAVCAVVAGYRSYTAIAEWVADLPADTAVLLGIDPGRRPSEAMIRRLLQAVDPDLLAAAIGAWLACRVSAPAAAESTIDGGLEALQLNRYTALHEHLCVAQVPSVGVHSIAYPLA